MYSKDKSHGWFRNFYGEYSSLSLSLSLALFLKAKSMQTRWLRNIYKSYIINTFTNKIPMNSFYPDSILSLAHCLFRRKKEYAKKEISIERFEHFFWMKVYWMRSICAHITHNICYDSYCIALNKEGKKATLNIIRTLSIEKYTA